ncbi:MAG: hypothetical protein WBC21_01155 [Minisyncoccales bacterium]
MKIVFPNKKQLDEQYKKEHPADFMTHLNYVSCLNDLSKSLVVKCNINLKNRLPETKNLSKKIRLINLVKRNLDEEYKLILRDPGFAEICVPWIAVKSYYLFFNLFLTLEYLITGEERSFFNSHHGVLENLKRHIRNKELEFNKTQFNKIYKGGSILKWKAKPHANIKITSPNTQERFFQIIKILMRYYIEDFKRKEKLKTLNCKKGKSFLNKSNINICEFFYWYRIKSNYRDLEFLDKDISDDWFSDFYRNYFELTSNFYKTIQNLINNLSKIRLNKMVL